MVASQFVRLTQQDPGMWIFWDYAGRLGGLTILAIIPSARSVAFRRVPLRMVLWKVVLWVAGIVLLDHYLGGWTRRIINAALPTAVLGAYPQSSGWLSLFDIVFGLALVAYSEEIVFRRCARRIFQVYLGDGSVSIIVTSLLFGAYHWWAGVGNIVEATMTGILLMLFFRRSEALWPVVLAHYLTDVIDFG
jgi:uncharacterized protein